jgi:type VI secretion system ImpM family protein
VLGSLSSSNDWQWAVYGKHPVARDYVSLGGHLPLVKTLSGWIDKGFELVRSQQGRQPRYCSWRFWVSGGSGDVLSCGLLRDSRDGAGRAYPLLILLNGSLGRWKEHWDLLPFACERVWNHMEQATVKMYDSLRSMEIELERVPPPSPMWAQYIGEKDALCGVQSASESERFREAVSAMEHQAQSLGNATELYLPLQQWPSIDPMAIVGCWHSLLKAQQPTVPNVVFMGGTPADVSLVIFKRPLTVNDFVRLWS